MKKQGFILGSFILVSSVIISKIIGILFKIPLANILGGTGMGYFSCAYAIFMPVYAISVTGLPAAVSKMVSQNVGFGKYANVKKIRRAALIGFSALGLISSILIALLAKPLTTHVIENKNALIAVYAIAPCILFGAMISVYRGYFEGLRNMFPTAISQIIEAVVKLCAGLGFSYLTLAYTKRTFLATGSVFGTKCTNLDMAYQISLPYVAAAAILGVTLSSAIALIYLIIRYRLLKDSITKEMIALDTSTERMSTLLKKLMCLVIPIALGSVITNLTSLIDLGTIIRSLNTIIQDNQTFFKREYYYVLDQNTTLEMLPNFIYGSFTGLAITIFNLIPSVTNMFGKGILPSLSEAWAKKDQENVTKNIKSVIYATSLVAIPAGIGISVLAKPILNFLYSSRPVEILTIEDSVRILGIGVIFLSLSVPAFAILQAIGRADLPVKIICFGVIIKLVGNISLIYIPQINIDGAAISTTICYLFVCVTSLIFIKTVSKAKLQVFSQLFKIIFSAILCGITAKLSYDFFYSIKNSNLMVLFAIACGGIVYIICLYLTNINAKKSLKEIYFK